MKIELKINADTVLAVNELLKNVYQMERTIDKRQQVYRSIGFDLADKFDTKAKELVKKSTLFDAKKKHKISLKFHEAWALEAILYELLHTTENEYYKVLVAKVISHLNEKTA
ncbi:hypothetical protein [Flavobacterium covae]|uniref:hypothetical protein n=1 Tax=Flavobacterium covae TaxID=2906076 RepID=UPI000745C3F0|nr:hypothetical protein [Flavobacterium covae]AMA49429.1 hypothetical protein AWN65_08150 [Flavobacterium covae]MCJ1808965.1 hypothetical protein [Flavobacterium covae]